MDSGTKRDQVILGMQISLDGYAARPDGSLDWVFSHFRPDLLEAVIANLSRLDTVVIGRRNYQEQASHWPNESGPIADIMNSVEKVVFSKTLRPEDLTWQNSRLAEGSPAEEISRLREEGRTIGVPGGASFAGALAAEGLIDRYNLAIHPVVLGEGIPLFTSDAFLDLVESQSFSSGVVFNVYRPAEERAVA